MRIGHRCNVTCASIDVSRAALTMGVWV